MWKQNTFRRHDSHQIICRWIKVRVRTATVTIVGQKKKIEPIILRHHFAVVYLLGQLNRIFGTSQRQLSGLSIGCRLGSNVNVEHVVPHFRIAVFHSDAKRRVPDVGWYTVNKYKQSSIDSRITPTSSLCIQWTSQIPLPFAPTPFLEVRRSRFRALLVVQLARPTRERVPARVDGVVRAVEVNDEVFGFRVYQSGQVPHVSLQLYMRFNDTL